ncbi:MAG TPA: hypothetical protein VMR21_08160 [Vicinamibacteria bacterium]|nr:hypothetical protein [Vicinamibacteria bacterium]
MAPARPSRAGVDLALGALAALVLAAAALAFPPRPFGDAAEYLLMAESWAAHGSPEVRPSDVEALRRRAAASGLAVHPEDALGNYFQGDDRRSYSYHFWAYALSTMPARLALRALGADELRAFPLTNALAFAAAIAAVLVAAPATAFARRAAAALLATSPALGFVLWPHPEVLSFAAATMAVVAGARGATGTAALCAAVASTQNPPLVLLVAFEVCRPLLSGSWPRWTARTWAALGLAALVALASPLFYLALFSTPSMVAGQATGVQPVSIGRALGLLFDLELGLVRYAPATVALLLGLVPRMARGPARGLETGLFALLGLMMLASSATGNWNHGTTGPSRYVVWLFPLVAYLLALGPTASRLLAAPGRAYRALLVAAVAAQVVVAAARGGVLSPPDYLEHSTAARAVLDRHPSWYDPDEEVFRERTAHTEATLDGPFIHERAGRCRKALARWKHAGTLRARCGALPDRARPFFDSRPPREEKSRWIYVDYP